LLTHQKPKNFAAIVPIPSHLQQEGQSLHQATIHLQTQHNTTNNW